MKLKRFTAIVLCFVIAFSLFSFTACTGPKDVMGLKIDENCYVNNTPAIGYSEKTYQDTQKNIANLKALVEKEEASELSCQVLSMLVSVQLYKLIDALQVATLYYYSDMTDEANKNGYADLYDKYSGTINEFKKLYKLFAESKYKTVFFGEDTTDEEIQELVSKAVSSDELVALNGKVVTLQTQYNDFTDEQIFGSDYDELYTELVQTLNGVGKIYGFDNYLDYSYAYEYSRDYTPTDTLRYFSLLSNGVIEAAEKSSDNFYNALNSINDQRMNELDDILDDSFTSPTAQAVLDGFYRSLGDDIYKIYKHLINDGYYYIAKSENAYAGAFTNYFNTISEPYMYFSPGYDTVNTFVHEFGHYCRFYLCGNNDDASYELLETHSQGAEWLFASYISKSLPGNEKSYFVNSKFSNNSYSILLCAIVGAAEIDVYTLTDFSSVDYNAIIKARSAEIWGNAFPEVFYGYTRPEYYYRLVSVNSPGYYISYSVSLISSLEIYVQGVDSYESAVSSYMSLLNTDSLYVEALEEAGLGSPFDKATIESICNTFSNAG